MTEPVEKASSQAAAGQLLRQAREAAGIHIAALAVAQGTVRFEHEIGRAVSGARV